MKLYLVESEDPTDKDPEHMKREWFGAAHPAKKRKNELKRTKVGAWFYEVEVPTKKTELIAFLNEAQCGQPQDDTEGYMAGVDS